MARTTDLTSGGIAKKLIVLSLPLILSNVLQILFNMSDIAVVGRFAGDTALGAVGSTAIYTTVYAGFMIGVGAGINSLVALFFGAKDEKSTEESVHTSLIIAAATGVALWALGTASVTPVLTLLGTKEEFMSGACLYLRIYFTGMPALGIYNFGAGVWSAVGNTKKPLTYLSIAGVLNVALNMIFVTSFHMDVAGVALATVISEYLSAAMILVSLFRQEGSFGLSAKKLRLTPDKARRVVSLGYPAGLQNAIFGFASLFVQAGVNTFDPVCVEGCAAAANSDGLVYDTMAAIYTVTSSFVAQNFGAKKKDRIKKSYAVGLAWSFLAGAVCGALLMIFGREFLSLFTKSPEVVDAGMRRLVIMSASYGVSAFMDCTIAASRGLGKTAVPTAAVMLGSCVFRVIWIYTVFAYFGTMTSLFLLYVFSWTLTGAFEIAYFVFTFRRVTASFGRE